MKYDSVIRCEQNHLCPDHYIKWHIMACHLHWPLILQEEGLMLFSTLSWGLCSNLLLGQLRDETRLLSALKAYKYEGCTAWVGNLFFYCLTLLTVKKFFHISSPNFSCFKLCPSPSPVNLSLIPLVYLQVHRHKIFFQTEICMPVSIRSSVQDDSSQIFISACKITLIIRTLFENRLQNCQSFIKPLWKGAYRKNQHSTRC